MTYWALRKTHLVRLVVVLRVEFENLRLLLVVKSTGQVICAKLLPPLLTVDEPEQTGLAILISHRKQRPSPNSQQTQCNVHILGSLDIELAGAQEAQHGQGIQSLRVPLLLQHCPQLVHLRILFRRGVAWVASLRLRRGGGEVVLVVLGVGGQ